jgi:hypothetical protein
VLRAVVHIIDRRAVVAVVRAAVDWFVVIIARGRRATNEASISARRTVRG